MCAQGLDDAFVSGRPGSPHSVDDLVYDPADPVDRLHIDWRSQEMTPPPADVPEVGGEGEGPAAPAPEPSLEAAAQGPRAASLASDASGAHAAEVTQLPMELQLQKDAFLVFRALCKLSIRNIDAAPASELMTIRGKVWPPRRRAGLPPTGPPTTALAAACSQRMVQAAWPAHAQVLALELLKILLENSGPVFQSAERFIGAIKQYLCLSLLKNCSSSVPQALRLCCSIFLTLMVRFRKHLKAEIGVFFPMIMLRPIETIGGSQAGRHAACRALAASGCLSWTGRAAGIPCGRDSKAQCKLRAAGSAAGSIDTLHKAVVLRCLQSQCQDGQLLVDMFVNYDCDLEGANLFERTVRRHCGGTQLAARHNRADERPGLIHSCCWLVLSQVLALVRIAQGSTAQDALAANHTEQEALRDEVSALLGTL